MKTTKRTGWIDVYASGHVSLRRGELPARGTLPCYDAGSPSAARRLIVGSCISDRVDGRYRLPGTVFKAEVLESIDKAAKHFEDVHGRQHAQALARMARKAKERRAA
jgi:hypothetical protein